MTYYTSKALFFYIIFIQFQAFDELWYQLLYSCATCFCYHLPWSFTHGILHLFVEKRFPTMCSFNKMKRKKSLDTRSEKTMGRMIQNIPIKIVDIDCFARDIGPSVVATNSISLFWMIRQTFWDLAVSVGINELIWSQKIGDKTIDLLSFDWGSKSSCP